MLQLDKNGFPFLKLEGADGIPAETNPYGADTEEWARRHDAVRSAAQELEPMEIGDVQDHIAPYTQRNLSDPELAQFVSDVRKAKVDHVVDWMHGKLSTSVLGLRARRRVRIVPPRGWVTRTLGNLSNDEVKNVVDRLEIRGHNRDEVTKNLVSRFSTARQEQLSSEIGTSE